MSWAELIGALLGLAMVVCNIRQIHWGWPLAFTSSVLYVVVFGKARLYAEAALQIVFALTAVWGWMQWLRSTGTGEPILHSQRLSRKSAIKLIAACALLWLIIGLISLNFTDTDVPGTDALITALSLVGTWLLGRKYLENWPVWIIVNILSVALFASKGLWVTVILYAVFIAMAVIGWRVWLRSIPLKTLKGPP